MGILQAQSTAISRLTVALGKQHTTAYLGLHFLMPQTLRSFISVVLKVMANGLQHQHVVSLPVTITNSKLVVISECLPFGSVIWYMAIFVFSLVLANETLPNTIPQQYVTYTRQMPCMFFFYWKPPSVNNYGGDVKIVENITWLCGGMMLKKLFRSERSKWVKHFLTWEEKFHISKGPCNFLSIILYWVLYRLAVSFLFIWQAATNIVSW